MDLGNGCHTDAFFTAQEPPSLAFLARHLARLPARRALVPLFTPSPPPNPVTANSRHSSVSLPSK